MKYPDCYQLSLFRKTKKAESDLIFLFLFFLFFFFASCEGIKVHKVKPLWEKLKVECCSSVTVKTSAKDTNNLLYNYMTHHLTLYFETLLLHLFVWVCEGPAPASAKLASFSCSGVFFSHWDDGHWGLTAGRYMPLFISQHLRSAALNRWWRTNREIQLM